MVSLASPSAAMLPPPTPLKRPTLTSLKRNSSYLDTDDEAGLSSSTKKLRVTFSPTVDIRIMDDPNDKSLDLIKEEIHQAVEAHIAPLERRDDSRYIRMLQSLSQDVSSGDAMSSRVLKKYLAAIDSRISRLGACGNLVSTVIETSWLGRDDAFVELYAKVLCDIASAHGKFVPGMMKMLVQHFGRLPASLGRLPEETPVSRARMFARVHLLIMAIICTVPSASSALLVEIKAAFPNDTDTARTYLQYERHLLRLTEEVKELKAEIIALVVQKLVATDVQVQQDLEDMDEDAEDRLLQRPSLKYGDGEESDDSDIDSASESEFTTTEEEQRLQELRLKVGKMDGTLDLLFEYYTPLMEDPTTSTAAYQELLTHFATFILPHRCRHAQFLQFHYSQFSAANTTLFVQQCLNMATHNSAGFTHRLTATAYVASFIARGVHISSSQVRDFVSVLCNYLNELKAKYEPGSHGPDRRTYALYYAIAQALIYIFCFRWRDLVTGSTSPEYDTDISEEDTLAEGHDLVWMPGLQETFRQNIHSKLNPLKVCSPDIVGEFAKIANHLRFLYVFSLIEANKRLRLGLSNNYYGNGVLGDIGRRETAFDRKHGEKHHQLEAYFPFDPYHLPKSKRWVKDDYNEWKLPKGMKRDDIDDDEDEEVDEEDAEDGAYDTDSDEEYESAEVSIMEVDETKQHAMPALLSSSM